MCEMKCAIKHHYVKDASMRKYLSHHIYMLLFLLSCSVMQLYCAGIMVPGQSTISKFKTRSDIVVVPSFMKGMIFGAAVTLGSRAASSPALALAVYSLYNAANKKSIIDDLERAVSEGQTPALMQQMQRKEIAELWRRMWLTNALIQPNESGYAALCKIYNELLERNVKSQAKLQGFVFGYICGTFAILKE